MNWLEYGIDYTVTDLEDQDIGGTLTLINTIPPKAEQLVIRRVTPKTQEIDLHNGARLPAELIETMGNKATMQIQEIAEQTLSIDIKNEILHVMNLSIEEAKAAVWEALNNDMREAIANEATARISRDGELTEIAQGLQQQINTLQTKQDEHQYLIEYLILLYESKFGPLNGSFPLIAERGHYLVTENSDYLVVA